MSILYIYVRTCRKKNIQIVYNSIKKHQSILNTLYYNNIIINSQCKDGYCGTCCVSLMYGTIKYFKHPLAYIQKNNILTCCCIPTSDIQIHI